MSVSPSEFYSAAVHVDIWHADTPELELGSDTAEGAEGR